MAKATEKALWTNILGEMLCKIGEQSQVYLLAWLPLAGPTESLEVNYLYQFRYYR